MFVKSTVAVALLLTCFVAAQDGTNFTNFTINPDSIDPTTRSQWCLGQRNTCGTLCGGDLNTNDCDVTTLAYDCTCGANGSAPGLQYYENSMPTYICEKTFDRCISDNEGVASAQANCRAAEAANCGHLDPAEFTAVADSSSASATSTPTGTVSPASTGTSAPTSSSTGAAATMMPAQLGTGAIALGFAAALGYMF